MEIHKIHEELLRRQVRGTNFFGLSHIFHGVRQIWGICFRSK